MKFALPTIHLSRVVLYTFNSYLRIETKKNSGVKNRSSKRSRNLHNVNFSHVCDTLVVDPRNKLVFISDCVKTWFLLFHVKMKTRKTIPEKRILKKSLDSEDKIAFQKMLIYCEKIDRNTCNI